MSDSLRSVDFLDSIHFISASVRSFSMLIYDSLVLSLNIHSLIGFMTQKKKAVRKNK